MDHRDAAETRHASERPKRVQLVRDGSGLTLSYDWFQLKQVFVTLWCVLWDGFTVYMIQSALNQPAGTSTWFVWIPVTVGVVITYSTLAAWINRTRVTVSMDAIKVRHAPMPWFGNTEIQKTELEELHCERCISLGQGGRAGRYISYYLIARMRNGRRRRLLDNLPDRETAQYLVSEIAKEPGIVCDPTMRDMDL